MMKSNPQVSPQSSATTARTAAEGHLDVAIGFPQQPRYEAEARHYQRMNVAADVRPDRH
jgi:hypothetical protein